MRLLIVSHVPHYEWDGGIYAYGPYAREIDIWAELFSEIVIAAPGRREAPPADSYRINCGNLRLAPQKEVGGESFFDKLGLYASVPVMCFGLAAEMRKAEAIHVRCPGNIGLLGAVLAPMFSKLLIAKYAGQWTGYPGEEFTVRMQRAVLRSKWWGKPVTVYGNWPNQPPHVISFFTSLLSDAQLERASGIARQRRYKTPLTVAFTGRLTRSKNVDKLIRSIAAVNAKGVALSGLIVGDGPEMQNLTSLAKELGIAGRMRFTGGVPAGEVLDNLERADLFVLASETEGWPKSLAEAMAFGCICIGSDRGLIPEFLGEGRGFIVPAGDSEALSAVLFKIASAPADFAGMGLAASSWARRYSVEQLKQALKELMMRSWNVPDDQLCGTVPAPARQ